MGNWAIHIEGVGFHHNNSEDIDADLAAAALVKQLREMGQTIESATFTYGCKADLKAGRVVDYTKTCDGMTTLG